MELLVFAICVQFRIVENADIPEPSLVPRLLYSPDVTFGHSMRGQPAESTAVIKFDYLWK